MTLVATLRTGDILLVSLDRPEKGNALDREMSLELLSVVTDPTARDAILVFRSSSPGAFVAGADVAELRSRSVQDNLMLYNARLFDAIESHPCPTVAVVDGPALGGGCEFALSCDLRVGTPRSLWGLPEVTLGLVPAAGGLHRLERLVGRGTAMDLILTGRRMDGEEAHRSGLVQRMCDPEDLETTTDELLAQLTRASRLAQQLAKRAGLVTSSDPRAADAMAQALCVLDPGSQDRMSRFLERRGGRS
jgi:enoyl-CoA hydratase